MGKQRLIWQRLSEQCCGEQVYISQQLNKDKGREGKLRYIKGNSKSLSIDLMVHCYHG